MICGDHKVPQFGCLNCIASRGKLYDNNLESIAWKLQGSIKLLSFIADHSTILPGHLISFLFDVLDDLQKTRLRIYSEAYINTSESRFLFPLVTAVNRDSIARSGGPESFKS